MERARLRSSRSSPILKLLCASLFLSSRGLTSAGLLNWRQDDAAIAASEAIAAASGVTREAPSAVSTILAATGPAEAVATATNTDANTAATTAAAAATSVSKGTEAANSTIPAAAAATSDFSSPLNETNDPNECHATLLIGDLSNPFCKPYMGQTVQVGIQYEVTWDQSLFSLNSTNTIALLSVTEINDDRTANVTAVQQEKVPNSQGTVFLKMDSAWLNNGLTTNLTFSLENNQADTEPYILPGPEITLIGNNTSHSKPASKSKKLGEAIGIPMGLVFFIIAVALIAAFICMRKRRGLGYGGGKAARSQRMEAVTPVASRGHRRDASFHDEPTRGMELQDRNKGLTGEDNWDWGSPVSSPTTAGRNSNAFRDELERQKSGRRS